jgi:hypothetical protein
MMSARLSVVTKNVETPGGFRGFSLAADCKNYNGPWFLLWASRLLRPRRAAVPRRLDFRASTDFANQFG